MKKLKEQRGETIVAILLTIIFILIIGVGILLYIMNSKVLQKKSNVIVSNPSNVANQNIKDNELSTINEDQNVKTNIEFSDFGKIFAKTNKCQELYIDSEYSYMKSIYLYKGNVYFDIRESAINEKDKSNINKLKKEKINGIDTFNGSALELYKLPVADIILMSHKEYGQDGAGILLLENSEGEVYYVSLFQSGAKENDFFKTNGEININKSIMKEIVNFRNSENDGWGIYGIDINGKEIEFTDLYSISNQ